MEMNNIFFTNAFALIFFVLFCAEQVASLHFINIEIIFKTK